MNSTLHPASNRGTPAQGLQERPQHLDVQGKEAQHHSEFGADTVGDVEGNAEEVVTDGTGKNEDVVVTVIAQPQQNDDG
jgi:hypothetical protein